MPKITRPLSVTEIKNAKAKDKAYNLYDGNGLQVQVTPSGKKIFQFRYYRPNTRKRNMLSFGAFPAVSLKDARELAQSYSALIAKGIDPKEQRELERISGND